MALGEISEMEPRRWRRTRSFKAREFLWPQPRPLMLTRWLLHRARRGRAARQRRILPQQPVQNLYRPRQVRTLLERSGFRTARLITKVASPEAPLPGHYMRIYCLEAI